MARRPNPIEELLVFPDWRDTVLSAVLRVHIAANGWESDPHVAKVVELLQRPIRTTGTERSLFLLLTRERIIPLYKLERLGKRPVRTRVGSETFVLASKDFAKALCCEGPLPLEGFGPYADVAQRAFCAWWSAVGIADKYGQTIGRRPIGMMLALLGLTDARALARVLAVLVRDGFDRTGVDEPSRLAVLEAIEDFARDRGTSMAIRRRSAEVRVTNLRGSDLRRAGAVFMALEFAGEAVNYADYGPAMASGLFRSLKTFEDQYVVGTGLPYDEALTRGLRLVHANAQCPDVTALVGKI